MPLIALGSFTNFDGTQAALPTPDHQPTLVDSRGA